MSFRSAVGNGMLVVVMLRFRAGEEVLLADWAVTNYEWFYFATCDSSSAFAGVGGASIYGLVGEAFAGAAEQGEASCDCVCEPDAAAGHLGGVAATVGDE